MIPTLFVALCWTSFEISGFLSPSRDMQVRLIVGVKMCDWLSVSVSDPAVVLQQSGEIAYWNEYETLSRLNKSGSFTQLNTNVRNGFTNTGIYLQASKRLGSHQIERRSKTQRFLVIFSDTQNNCVVQLW